MLTAEWIKMTVDEIMMKASKPVPFALLIDNLSTFNRIRKDSSSNAQKAVDIRFHALKDAFKADRMTLEYVPTRDNPADLLTKSLGPNELLNKRALCGLK